jgi:hypothetical protein
VMHPDRGQRRFIDFWGSSLPALSLLNEAKLEPEPTVSVSEERSSNHDLSSLWNNFIIQEPPYNPMVSLECTFRRRSRSIPQSGFSWTPPETQDLLLRVEAENTFALYCATGRLEGATCAQPFLDASASLH